MTRASRLPDKQPLGITVADHAEMRDRIKAKYVPRAPRDGEVLLLLRRPQDGPYSFAEYVRGDLVGHGEERYVVLAAKAGYSRGGEGWKVWEQLAVARPATGADVAAVADQAAAQAAETQRVMDRMMCS